LLKLGLRVSLPHDPEVYETCAHFKACAGYFGHPF
jgi:hypothetical protein